jgi:transposase-like protein
MNTVTSTMAHVVGYNAACPACQSSDVRPSQRAGQYEFLHKWRNRQRYRCRTCRQSFYVALTAAERAKLRDSENIRKKRARGGHRFVKSRTQRRIIEAILFVAMLLIFYFVFNSLVNKGGGGAFGGSTTEAQP